MGFCGNQKRVLDTLELELQVFVNCLMWVLGTGLRSSGGAGSMLHCLVNPSKKKTKQKPSFSFSRKVRKITRANITLEKVYKWEISTQDERHQQAAGRCKPKPQEAPLCPAYPWCELGWLGTSVAPLCFVYSWCELGCLGASPWLGIF